MKALYVHVPFCDHICAYCDFTRCRYYEPLAKQWLAAIARELQQQQPTECRTLYIGGGTPSALSLSQLQQLLQLLAPYAKDCEEYTIEVNADSFSDDKISACQRYGINRISMGAQTFQKKLLAVIERKADYAAIADTIARIHSQGIHDISLDLMYGLPGQTMAQWEEDLLRASALPITHLSLYALTIEAHSTFGRNKVPPCDPDLEADFYEKAIQILTDKGFTHYEISNFARNQHYAKHNLMYWHYEDFYGIGCGASGKINHERYDNTRNLHTYITQGADAKRIALSREDEMFETMMMGLRLQQGIDKQQFYERFHEPVDMVYEAAIQKHVALSHLINTADTLKTTYRGMLLLHEILVDFL